MGAPTSPTRERRLSDEEEGFNDHEAPLLSGSKEYTEDSEHAELSSASAKVTAVEPEKKRWLHPSVYIM